VAEELHVVNVDGTIDFTINEATRPFHPVDEDIEKGIVENIRESCSYRFSRQEPWRCTGSDDHVNLVDFRFRTAAGHLTAATLRGHKS